jgi:DNA-binding transcriptional ArsR family regulator
MPVDLDNASAASAQVEVRPSAVMELTYLLWHLSSTKWSEEVQGLDAFKAARQEILDELEALWHDGHTCINETSILADRIGALLTDEAESFLRGLDRAAAAERANLDLRSEASELRAATLKRLERLRHEPALRRRYASLLSRVWGLTLPEWEARGRPAVRRACQEWTDRLARGAAAIDLLPPNHIVRRKPEHEPLLQLRPRLVISPIYFAGGGSFVIDMTGFVHVGRPAGDVAPDELRRRDSELMADRLKVLADGTRLALLRQLAREPAGVTELARRFRLAQPTVSNHVRLLRDAELLESRRDGARVVYTAARGNLGQLLARAERLLLED